MTAVNIDELCSSGVKIDRKQKRERRRRNIIHYEFLKLLSEKRLASLLSNNLLKHR